MFEGGVRDKEYGGRIFSSSVFLPVIMYPLSDDGAGADS